MSGTSRLSAVPGSVWRPGSRSGVRWRTTAAVVVVIASGGVAGWMWTRDPVGALLAAVCLTVLVAAVAVVPAVAARLGSSDARQSRLERGVAGLRLEVHALQGRVDRESTRLTGVGRRVEELDIAVRSARSERRNNVLDIQRRRDP